MHEGSAVLAKQKSRLTVGRIKQIVRETERKSTTGATGYTTLKLASKPIRRLLDDHAIGPDEFQAVQDIETAFFSISGAVMIKPLSMERQDPSYGGYEPGKVIDAQRRYRAWANHWSDLAKKGDRTLEIVIAAVIDERPFYLIEEDIGLRHGLARKATIRGLRDYAARAGWVKGAQAIRWKSEALNTFRDRSSGLSLAVARARAGL